MTRTGNEDRRFTCPKCGASRTYSDQNTRAAQCTRCKIWMKPTDAEAGTYNGQPICRECGENLSDEEVSDGLEYHETCV